MEGDFRPAYCTQCNRRIADLEAPGERAMVKCPRCRAIVVAVVTLPIRRRDMMRATG